MFVQLSHVLSLVWREQARLRRRTPASRSPPRHGAKIITKRSRASGAKMPNRSICADRELKDPRLPSGLSSKTRRFVD